MVPFHGVTKSGSQREGARKPGVESGSEHDSNGLNADLGH